ncbi:hypothetical protein OHT93_32355 [Streptomyces sp. NBC_00191]|uniref:hypothetical protein n=1 Tax=Streptomyces sp. NBC_00191 TaxID=2975674 RepID=UPI003243A9A7
MARPPVSDWAVLDLTEDPTPGETQVLNNLAGEYKKVFEEAESAFSVITRIESQELGQGKAMEALKEVLKELPKQVGALRDSFEAAAKAVSDYVPRLEDHQRKAEMALTNGREAKKALDTALASQSAAEASLSALDNAPKPADDDTTGQENARNARRDADNAVTSADGAVDAAQADLDAAKRLALDAKGLRETDAKTAATALGHAEDQAVKEKNFWDKLWDKIGSAFGIISAILGVISFVVAFIPGLQPLALALGAASLVFGLVPLGINIARGAVTGDWDIAGIVLGVVGTAFGGFSVIKGLGAALGPAIKGGLGNIGRGRGAGGTGSVSDDVDSVAPPSSSGSGSNPNVGTAADDIPLTNLPPRSNGPAPAPSKNPLDDFVFPWQNRPPSPTPAPSSNPLDDFVFPWQNRPPSSTGASGSSGSLADDVDSIPPRPMNPTPGSSNSTLGSGPGPISTYFNNMANGVRNDIPGAIGAGTAFGGTIYAPGATAGTFDGTVHGPPLVGNRNDDGT